VDQPRPKPGLDSQADLDPHVGCYAIPYWFGAQKQTKEWVVLDAWLVVAVFMLGAASGSLLARINYMGWENRIHREVSPEPPVDPQDDSLRSRTTELKALIFFGERSFPGSTWRKLANQYSMNLGE